MGIDSSITADTEEAIETPEKESHEYHGLAVYSYEGAEYALADDDDAADEAAAQAVMESLWAFNADFIARHSTVDLDSTCIKAIKEMQGSLCESCGPIIEAIIGNNIDAFVDDAIESDGRGHFLASYDNEERDGEDIHPSWKGKLAYRNG